MTAPAHDYAEVSRRQRWLLPGGMLDGGTGHRTARDWVVDGIQFLLAIAIGGLVVADTWDDHSRPWLVIDLALGVIALAALWRRRREPVGVAVLTTVLATFAASAGGAGLLALFNAAIRAPQRALGWLIALAVASSVIFPLLYPGNDSYVFSVLLGLLLTVVVVGWGLFVRVRRDLFQSLRERAERAEAEHQLRVEQAREAERRRIAREMHDVLAHRLSLLSVHAGALEFRPDAPPEEIAEAAGVIRSAARSALEELRAVVGLLRDAPAVEDGREPPQPTLAELPALLEESRASGMHLTWTLDVPERREIPPRLGRTVYRIVQEGLTNARKHAPGTAVAVSVAESADGLVVEVVSRRPVGVAAGAADPLPGAGTGLIGLSERVALAGGELAHGPDAGGDFVLRATLPWP